jgi:hypothetical protein
VHLPPAVTFSAAAKGEGRIDRTTGEFELPVLLNASALGFGVSAEITLRARLGRPDAAALGRPVAANGSAVFVGDGTADVPTRGPVAFTLVLDGAFTPSPR